MNAVRRGDYRGGGLVPHGVTEGWELCQFKLKEVSNERNTLKLERSRKAVNSQQIQGRDR